MFAWELQSSGAWQPCKWRWPSWEMAFLFPRQLMWAWGWDGDWKHCTSIGGHGRAGEQFGDVGTAQCHHCCGVSWWQDQDHGWSMSASVPLHPAHLCWVRTSTGWQQKCTQSTCTSPAAPPLTKELIPTPSSNLKTTVSPRSSCQNLQVLPQLPEHNAVFHDELKLGSENRLN